MSSPVILTRTGNVALLTLNRPDKLNALSFDLIDTLLARLDEIEADDGLRAVIVTGAGERAFSAGADIHEFITCVAAGAEIAVRDFVRRGQAMTARIEAFPKPVIAAVNGLAFGGGCEVTEAAHLAIASERATFAKPEIALGMPPTFGGTQRLPRLVGRKRGLELLLTSEPFPPSRAFEIGLVNAVVPHGRLLDEALALAGRISRHTASSVSAILAATTRGLNVGIAEGLQIESDQFARLVPTEDLRHELRSWITRRRQPAAGPG